MVDFKFIFDFGSPKTSPIIQRRSMTKSDVNEIHKIDMTNPKSAKQNIKCWMR